jgi:predicted nucleic-acid-binding protein
MTSNNNFKSVFVDANILLEIISNRANFDFAKQIFLDYSGNVYISILTAHLVFYFGKKYSIDIELIEGILELCKVIGSGQNDYNKALELYMINKDMEDSIQISTAINFRIDSFATFDQKLISKFNNKVDLQFLTNSRVLSTI